VILRRGRGRDAPEATSSSPESRTAAERLADEQAALRHVATLVARRAPPNEIFAAVVEEVGHIFDWSWVGLMRYESDDSFVVLAVWGSHPFEVGSRWPLDGPSTFETVRRTGRAARFDDYSGVPGTVAEGARAAGILGGIGAPIVVEGETWGVIAAPLTAENAISVGAEVQLEQFTELVAIAIANAESREARARLADEQAGLRRVATLVAGNAPPIDVFGAVTEELGRLFSADFTYVTRFDSEEAVTVLAGWMASGELPMVLPGRWAAGPTSTAIRAAGAPVRLDPYPRRDEREDPETAVVAAPITVAGALWGFLTVASTNAETPPPPGTEARLSNFADLVATAISNAESREALARLADEQAALRRVATLVATGVEPAPLFDAIAGEIEALFGADISAVVRFEDDGTVTVMGAHGGPHNPGARVHLDPDYVVAAVRRTRDAARFDLEDWEGEPPALVREWGVRSSLATPIVVEGALWGAITIATFDGALGAGTDARLAGFSELFATAIANTHSREQVTALAHEQAALRRVATLAARELAPVEVLLAVTEEAARVLEVEAVGLLRFEGDGTATLVAQSRTPWDPPPLGTRLTLEGENVIAAVHRTGVAARMDDWAGATGAVAAMADVLGVRSTVATPIVAEGRLWGTMVAATSQSAPLPAGIESRIGEFTELVATAISNAESREALGVLAEEQAALRRVAVLVAQQPSPEDVFTAVTEAVGPLLGADLAAMHVFTDQETATVVAGWAADGPMLPPGMQLPLDGDSAVARIFHTGAAARIDSYSDAEGETAEVARGLRLRSTVGAPIVVEGRLWGALMAATRGDQPLPLDAEPRIAAFTELVATAISNTESRVALGLLADEQAALRRVATLVAEGVPPADVFSVVSREVERVFAHMETTATVVRFDVGPECVLVGASRPVLETPLGTRWRPNDVYVSTRVLQTGTSARVDEADLAVGGFAAEQMRRQGYLSQVASPIVVEGHLWGAMTVSAGETLPADTEERLETFTELVATAIANAESQSELAASRRRIVAASDDARRRIERDLHDGIQQQLVSVGMDLGELEAALADGSELKRRAAAAASGLRDAIDNLREVSRGIHPAILAHGGLGTALRTLARRSSVPVQLDSTIDGRLPERVEVAAFYVVAEALTNVARHANASVVRVDVGARNGGLELSIRDDGAGGADPAGGSGLIGLKDRVEALGGRIEVESPVGRGTSLVVTLPLGGEVAADEPRPGSPARP
jgi:GAF domain-containing protein